MTTDPVLSAQTLGEALRLLMFRAGLTRDELADASSISTGSLSRYLGDVGVPPSDVLHRIATVLADRLGVGSDRIWVAFAPLLAESDVASVVRARAQVRGRRDVGDSSA
jgi:transcriptional regulator with XRE-family HTH domain